MVGQIRSVIAQKLLEALSRTTAEAGASLSAATLLPLFRVAVYQPIRKCNAVIAGDICHQKVLQNSHPRDYSELQFRLSLRNLCKSLDIPKININDLSLLGGRVLHELDVDSVLTRAHIQVCEQSSDAFLHLSVPWYRVASRTLNLVTHHPLCFWKESSLLSVIPKERVVVEYSSPNIAKPFHVGHLRSTILGECLSRLHLALGHSVTRLNFLGDWGTQFGYVKYGFDHKGLTKKDLETDAISKLHDAYVWANKQAETCPEVTEKAKDIFRKLEEGDQTELEVWQFFRTISITDLQAMYARLGIVFDEYHGESMYATSGCDNILLQMQDRGLLFDDCGKKKFMFAPNRSTTILKSDGTSLYLTRDIAAAIDRYKRYSFDRHYYVVDIGQQAHFEALFSALKALGHSFADKMQHIRFGRIKGFSSRKGTAPLLIDLLNDGVNIMKERQKNSTTTLVNGEEADLAAEALSLSAVTVADLKQRRHKDYRFHWDKALQATGDTGVSLQYTHCRLVRLQETYEGNIHGEADIQSLLHEQIAINLLIHIARRLVKAALKSLRVQDAPPALALARLQLFVASQHILATGLMLIGLQPLKKM